MASWPESALEASDDNESAPEQAGEYKGTAADAEAQIPKTRPEARLRRIGGVSSRSEIVRPSGRTPETTETKLITFELGPIGRAAMVERVSMRRLMELIDNKPLKPGRQGYKPKNEPPSRGQGL